jgi:hypothetical protein
LFPYLADSQINGAGIRTLFLIKPQRSALKVPLSLAAAKSNFVNQQEQHGNAGNHTFIGTIDKHRDNGRGSFPLEEQPETLLARHPFRDVRLHSI